MSARMDFLEKFARAHYHAQEAASAAEDARYEIGKIAKELESLVKDRDALRALLREILDRINADIDLEDGKPVISDELFERAEELCK